jgi:hypothetical protein
MRWKQFKETVSRKSKLALIVICVGYLPCLMLLSLIFDRDPLWKHLQIRDHGVLAVNVDGVHAECDKNGDLTYYPRYGNIKFQSHVIGACKTGSGMMILITPEWGKSSRPNP